MGFPEKVQVLSGFGTCLAAACSAITLIIIAGQYRQAKINNSFLFLQRFLEDGQKLWSACRLAQEEEDFQIALGHILGHLEFACVFLLEEAATSRVSNTVEETIIQYINDMNAENYHRFCENLIVNSKICKHLRDFSIQRRDCFGDPLGVAKMLALDGRL